MKRDLSGDGSMTRGQQPLSPTHFEAITLTRVCCNGTPAGISSSGPLTFMSLLKDTGWGVPMMNYLLRLTFQL